MVVITSGGSVLLSSIYISNYLADGSAFEDVVVVTISSISLLFSSSKAAAKSSAPVPSFLSIKLPLFDESLC